MNFCLSVCFPVVKKNPFSNIISAYLLMALFKKSGKQSYSQWGVEWNLGNKYNQRLPVFGLGSKNYNTVSGTWCPMP